MRAGVESAAWIELTACSGIAKRVCLEHPDTPAAVSTDASSLLLPVNHFVENSPVKLLFGRNDFERLVCSEAAFGIVV